MSRAYNPQREELYTIKDDFGPGVHQGERVQGIQSTMKLTNTAIGHPEIRYKDRLTVADVYKMGDELKIHLICPRCTNNLSISNKNKQVDYDLDMYLGDYIGATGESKKFRNVSMSVASSH